MAQLQLETKYCTAIGSHPYLTVGWGGELGKGKIYELRTT